MKVWLKVASVGEKVTGKTARGPYSIQKLTLIDFEKEQRLKGIALYGLRDEEQPHAACLEGLHVKLAVTEIEIDRFEKCPAFRGRIVEVKGPLGGPCSLEDYAAYVTGVAADAVAKPEALTS